MAGLRLVPKQTPRLDFFLLVFSALILHPPCIFKEIIANVSRLILNQFACVNLIDSFPGIIHEMGAVSL